MIYCTSTLSITKETMEILQCIQDTDTLYIFTDNPKEDIKVFKDKYENDTSTIRLWCQEPYLNDYKFLGKEYECINLWFDYEDEVAEEVKKEFDKLIK